MGRTILIFLHPDIYNTTSPHIVSGLKFSSLQLLDLLHQRRKANRGGEVRR